MMCVISSEMFQMMILSIPVISHELVCSPEERMCFQTKDHAVLFQAGAGVLRSSSDLRSPTEIESNVAQTSASPESGPKEPPHWQPCVCERIYVEDTYLV